MTNIMFKDHKDPSFRYEGLARKVFNDCPKCGDPWGYAAQDYFSYFIPNPKIEAKRALSTIINKMIFDSQNQLVIVKKLLEIENKIWLDITQVESIDIIDELIKITDEIY